MFYLNFQDNNDDV